MSSNLPTVDPTLKSTLAGISIASKYVPGVLYGIYQIISVAQPDIWDTVNVWDYLSATIVTWAILIFGYVLQSVTDGVIIYGAYYADYNISIYAIWIFLGVAGGCFLWSISVMASVSSSAINYGEAYWKSAGRPDDGTIQSYIIGFSQLFGLLPSGLYFAYTAKLAGLY